MDIVVRALLVFLRTLFGLFRVDFVIRETINGVGVAFGVQASS